MQQEPKIVVVKYYVLWSNKLSRIAKQPVEIPNDVEVNINDSHVSFKGPKGEISMDLHSTVNINKEDKVINVETNVIGVTQGFHKILNLVGVGYKAEVKNKELHLSLGFSHPVIYKYTDDIEIKTPSPTEIHIKGISKQKVGQIAAEIRAFRPPEPYKGKGVKYSDENVIRKEAKKK